MTDSETHVIWHCTSICKAMFQQWWDLRLLVTRLWSWFGSRANPWIYLKCSVGLTLSSPLQCTSDCPHRAAAIFHHSYLPLLETRPPWRGMASAGLRQGVLHNEWTKKRSKIQVGTPSLMVVYRKDSLTLLWHVCRRVSFVCVFCLFWCFSLCLFACSNAHWVASACTSTNPAAQRAATRVFWYCMFVYKSSQIAKPFSRPMSESMVPSIKAAWIKEPDNKDSQLLAQQHFHRACRKFNSGGPVSLQIAKATNVKNPGHSLALCFNATAWRCCKKTWQFSSFSFSQIYSLGQKMYPGTWQSKKLHTTKMKSVESLKSLLGRYDCLEASIVHDHMHMFQSDMLVFRFISFGSSFHCTSTMVKKNDQSCAPMNTLQTAHSSGTAEFSRSVHVQSNMAWGHSPQKKISGHAWQTRAIEGTTTRSMLSVLDCCGLPSEVNPQTKLYDVSLTNRWYALVVPYTKITKPPNRATMTKT